MNSVHIILQGKGGVGKTLISTFISQALIDHGHKTVCINTDTVNTSFCKFSSLNVNTYPLFENNRINPESFDSLIEKIVSCDSDVVIDNGSSSFIPIASYIRKNNIVDFLKSQNKDVYIHIPITGGSSQADTLTGFDKLVKDLPSNTKIVLWENKYFGSISNNGKSLKELPIYKKHEKSLHGHISLDERDDFFSRDLNLMTSKHLLFSEIKESKSLKMMSKQRLMMIRASIYEQLNKLIPLKELIS